MYKTGDIILVHTIKASNWFMTFLARAIRFFQNSEWNHAGLIVEIDNLFYVSEANQNGIGFIKLSDYMNHRFKVLIIRFNQDIPESTLFNIKHTCIEWCGNVPYGFLNLFVYQPVKYITKPIYSLFKFIGIPLKENYLWLGSKSNLKNMNSMICGKWVMFIYFRYFRIFENWFTGAPADILKSNLFSKIYAN